MWGIFQKLCFHGWPFWFPQAAGRQVCCRICLHRRRTGHRHHHRKHPVKNKPFALKSALSSVVRTLKCTTSAVCMANRIRLAGVRILFAMYSIDCFHWNIQICHQHIQCNNTHHRLAQTLVFFFFFTWFTSNTLVKTLQHGLCSVW